jgi:hypothetical protein
MDEFDAMREQPFEGRGAVVGKGADDLAVVVAVIGKAVRPDHRPVGQIAEQEVRRIRDAVSLLDAGATAERDIATADDGMAADILLGFDKDYGTACFACDNRGGQPCRPRADHDDIGLAVPVNRVLACRRAGYGSAQRPRHHPVPLPTMICLDRQLPSTAKIVAQKLAKRSTAAT